MELIKAEGFQAGKKTTRKGVELVVVSAMSNDGEKVVVKPVDGGSLFVAHVWELASTESTPSDQGAIAVPA